MIDDSEKRNRQLAFELQNSHVCEKRSKLDFVEIIDSKIFTSPQPFPSNKRIPMPKNCSLDHSS